MDSVWVVTYWDGEEEPIVTVFNNEFSANKYLDYIQNEKKHDGYCIDECPVYQLFNVTKDDFTK